MSSGLYGCLRVSSAPHLWPHAVLHAIEVNAEQIIFFSIDFNGKTCFDMRVLCITSILLERIMLVIRGSTVLTFLGVHNSDTAITSLQQRCVLRCCTVPHNSAFYCSMLQRSSTLFCCVNGTHRNKLHFSTYSPATFIHLSLHLTNT